ncbi:MAG: M23 family metallopeptidase [Clostridiales bacterium]|nr:M23 family metallopeptidase [Clostridiales bacterium]
MSFNNNENRNVNSVKENIAALKDRIQTGWTNFRMDKLSRFSNRTLAGMGTAIMCVLVVGGVLLAVSPGQEAVPAAPEVPAVSAIEETVTPEEPAVVVPEPETSWTICIGGNDVLYFETEEDAQAVLDGLVAYYQHDNSVVNQVIYSEPINIREVDGEDYEFLSVEDSVTTLVTGTKEPKTYTVVSGDSLWDIAYSNNMTLEELIAANPAQADGNLYIGEVLNLFECKPYVTVTLNETITATENINYSIQYEETSTLYKGQYQVQSPGVYGKKEVVSQVVSENGREVSSKELSSEVISEPVTQITLAGTKSLSTLVGTGSFTDPLGNLVVTSSYGSRGGRSHTGVDLDGNTGDPIYAVDDGVVTFAGTKGAYGKLVKISHGNGVETWYGHCNKLHVSVGDVVSKGDRIADVGNTGRSYGSHLHFEVRVNGVSKNPMNYL